MYKTSVVGCSALLHLLLVTDCNAQGAAAVDAGWDWALVDHAGNSGYVPPLMPPGTPNIVPAGTGRVDYEFRISRTELQTDQWMAFVNAFPVAVQAMGGLPNFWGASFDFTRPLNERCYLTPGIQNASMVSVSGISFLASAAYCNWLCGGKSNNPAVLRDGAYDLSIFFDTGIRPAAYTRQAGARYWIPSLNEATKAFFYDPNRYGANQGGYWQFSNSSDVAPVWGMPTSGGEANAGTDFNVYLPIGSYPTVQTPWGLLDAAGCGGPEWTDTQDVAGVFRGMFTHGSGYSSSGQYEDAAFWASARIGHLPVGSFRLATTVPAPAASVFLVFVVTGGLQRARRSRTA